MPLSRFWTTVPGVVCTTVEVRMHDTTARSTYVLPHVSDRSRALSIYRVLLPFPYYDSISCCAVQYFLYSALYCVAVQYSTVLYLQGTCIDICVPPPTMIYRTRYSTYNRVLLRYAEQDDSNTSDRFLLLYYCRVLLLYEGKPIPTMPYELCVLNVYCTVLDSMGRSQQTENVRPATLTAGSGLTVYSTSS